MPMKIHLPPDVAIKSSNSGSRSRLALIWPTQESSAPAAMMSRSSDFVRLTLIAKLSSTKNTANLPRVRRARSLRRSISLTMLSLLRNRIESPKNPVTVQNSQPYGHPRPDSMGMIWKLSHSYCSLRINRTKERRNPVELPQVERLPGNHGVLLQVGFLLLSER